MPLSTPAARTPFHTRRVTCEGFHREDGLWDIEGRIVDTKAYELSFYDGRTCPVGSALHEMHIRITIDDEMVIHAAEACTEHSPFVMCPEISPAYHALVGLKIGPGFTAKVKELFRGTKGCTHLTELMGPVATTAFQTVSSGRRHLARLAGSEAPLSIASAKLVNTCHGWRSDGDPVKVQLPDMFHKEK